MITIGLKTRLVRALNKFRKVYFHYIQSEDKKKNQKVVIILVSFPMISMVCVARAFLKRKYVTPHPLADRTPTKMAIHHGAWLNPLVSLNY